MDDEALLDFWTAYMAAENIRPATLKDRLTITRALLRRSGMTLLTISRHDLIVELGRELAPRSKQHYRSLFHTLFTWLQDEGFRADNPAARLPRTRVPRVEADPVTTEQFAELLTSGIYARTRLYVLLFAYQGFRPVEIAAVSSDSIDWDRQRIRTDEAKGGVTVWRPIHPIVWTELQKYRREGWLFPTPGDPTRHVSRNNVSNVIGKAMRRAGIRHRPQQLRAWHATELLEAGVPIQVAQHSMRHATVSTMKHYAKVSDESVRAAIQLLPRIEVPDRSGRKRAA